jgi:hypothetical protein
MRVMRVIFELGSTLPKLRRNMTSFLNVGLILEKKLRVATCLYHDDMLKKSISELVNLT